MAKSLREKRPDLERRQTDRLIAHLNLAFPEAAIEGYEQLIPAMTNDADDRHVLAAAVAAHANVLVTWNVQHFAAAACEPYQILVQTPDRFLCDLLDDNPGTLAAILGEQAEDLSNPPLDREQLLNLLSALVPDFAALVRTVQLG